MHPPRALPPQVTLFGGTFDPVHQGHLDLARRLADRFHLDCIYFVPARQNPLKHQGPKATAAQRLEMLRLAIDEMGDPRMGILDWEAKSDRPSYTVVTVEKLKESGVKEVTLILGNEVFDSLPRWKTPERLLREVDILIATRVPKAAPEVLAILGRCSISDGAAHANDGEEVFRHSDGRRKIAVARLRALPFSSTTLRREAAKNPDSMPKGMVPTVWSYIKRNGLYAVKEKDTHS